MSTRAIRWRTIIGCGFVLAALVLAVPATAQRAATENNPTVTFRPERLTMNGDLVYRSGTMLVRTREYVFATIHTSGLNPGWVYTGWFGIFNNPEECATSPCTPADLDNPAVEGSLVNFGGRVIGADGVADFAEVRAVDDTTNAFRGPGLLDPRRAEIHLAVRSHGPVNPLLLQQQLTMFNGGCPPNMCVTVQAAVHQP